MAHERQTKRSFSLVARQPRGGFQHLREFIVTRQFPCLRGDSTGNLGKLFVAGTRVLQDYELLFQLGGKLHDGRQYHDKRASLLAQADLPGYGLNDFGRTQKPMKVHEHQERGTFGGG